MIKKERIDKILVERGIVTSRERARALIMGGKVLVNGQLVDKAGLRIRIDSEIKLCGQNNKYVSRGGLKLESALKAFRVNPKDKIVLDVGASTGGFTDCILQHGAQKVYAVDVGYGQLSWKLRNDPRVVNLERRNVRYLKKEEIGEDIDLVLIDTSFISIEKFLSHILDFLKEGGEILCLIKPQFEVGKGEVGKGGVVKDPILHKKVIERISKFSEDLGLKVIGVVESPLLGPKGNKEFFIYLRKGEKGYITS